MRSLLSLSQNREVSQVRRPVSAFSLTVSTLIAAATLFWTLGLLSLTSSASAIAATRKVVLLTSVDGVETARATPSYLFWLRGKYYSLNAKLEQAFRKHFEGSEFEVEAFHYADLSLLEGILHSPEYAGVYWVSHGADTDPTSLTATGGLYDFQTFDISSVFQEIHPALNLLTLVSCHSSKVVEQLQAEGRFASEHPALRVLSYRDQVDALAGLKAALAKGDHSLRAANPDAKRACGGSASNRSGIFVTLERACSQQGPALSFAANTRMFATFSACQAHETQTGYGFLDLNSDDLADIQKGSLDPTVLDVTVSTGAQPIDRVMSAAAPYFGDITIRRSGQSDWALLELRGKAVGVDHRIFSFREASPVLESVVNYRPYRCR